MLNKMFGDIIKTREVIREYENRYTGVYGEELTNECLEKWLVGNYKLARNVCIPIGNKATELDMVLIHEKGIFVIESKNYGGWIFGDEKSDNWCQTFPSGDKYFFYNPIKQNNTHCVALSKLLNISVEQITSYIVFSERCTLKKVPEYTHKFTICKRNMLMNILNTELEKRPFLYDNKRLELIYNLLNSRMKYEYQEKHERYVKMFKEGKICPKCGKELVVRNAAYDQDDFIGCSGYPNCRFNRNITSKDLDLFGVEWDIQFIYKR